MTKRITWICDVCRKEAEGSVLGILPSGWLEISFYNIRWYRYAFCSYSHLVGWAEARESYYGNKYVKTEEVPSAGK